MAVVLRQICVEIRPKMCFAHKYNMKLHRSYGKVTNFCIQVLKNRGIYLTHKDSFLKACLINKIYSFNSNSNIFPI